MPPKSPDHRAGKGADETHLPAAEREELFDAVLLACGERGFRKLRWEDVLSRCNLDEPGCEREFASLKECYTAAYEQRVGQLCDRILAAAAKSDSWREGLRAGLAVLVGFVETEPVVAKALLVEVHAAGSPAGRLRNKMFERLSNAVDTARRETMSRHSPPPLTALFMVNAIDSALSGLLINGEADRAADIAAGLEQLVLAAYFED